MDKMIIICDIGVNSKTGSVYKIPIVDSDHIHILNTVGNETFSQAIDEYIDYYNNRRIQMKTKWMPPARYREASMC